MGKRKAYRVVRWQSESFKDEPPVFDVVGPDGQEVLPGDDTESAAVIRADQLNAAHDLAVKLERARARRAKGRRA